MTGVHFLIHVTLSILELRESKQKKNDSGTRKNSHPAQKQQIMNPIREKLSDANPSRTVNSASGGFGLVLKHTSTNVTLIRYLRRI